MDGEELVVLNVGGTKFTTYKSTLMAYPDTLLARMFSSSAQIAKKGKDGEYFFDRDPKVFEEILNFYRTKRIIAPKGVPLARIKDELDYFGINIDEDDIEVEGERVDNVEIYLSVHDTLTRITSGNLLGIVMTGLKDELEETKTKETDDLKNCLSNLHGLQTEFGGGNVGGKKFCGDDFEYVGSKVKQHTSDDHYVHPDTIPEDKKTPEQDATDAEHIQKINKNLEQLRSLSNFCCGGWFELLEDNNNIVPHLRVLQKQVQTKKISWYWAGDSGKKGKQQDKWIAYDDDLSAKIEVSYQIHLQNANQDKGKGKTPTKSAGVEFQVDEERFIDFDDMQQKRYDDKVNKCRGVKREEIEEDEQPKKASKTTKGPKKAAAKKKGAKSTQNWVDCGPITQLNVDTLADNCTVAPFGDLSKMKTVVDENVRIALECDTNRFKLPKNMLWSIFDCSILKYMNSVLFKEPVELKPYKVNVYGKGGFFKAHTDTPIDAGAMVGTLLLCLPTPHKGGALRVAHEGIEHTFDFAALSNTNKIQWAAFYGDCEHEVFPVEEGNRVTIAFTINSKKLLQEKGIKEAKQESDDETDADYNKQVNIKYFKFEPGKPIDNSDVIVQAIQESTLALSYNTVGLLFAHKYTIRGLSPENLKGRDKSLYDSMAACNKLKVELIPVAIRVHIEGPSDERESGEEEESNICRAVYSFSTEDMNFLRNKGPKPTPKYTRVPFIAASTYGQQLYHYHYGGRGGFTGNCANSEDDSVYLCAALIVTKK